MQNILYLINLMGEAKSENLAYIVSILIGYFVLMIALPALCLKPLVKNLNFGIRFVIYLLVSNLYLSVIGSFLALLNIFNGFTIWITLVILPILGGGYFQRRALQKKWEESKESIEAMIADTYGRKIILRRAIKYMRGKIFAIHETYIKNNVWEFIIMILGIMFVVLFYGYYKLSNTAYGFTDEEMYLHWTKSLISGEAFPTGIYPYGMHFVIAAISLIFGIDVTVVTLFIPLAFTLMVFLVLYVAMRYVFHNRYVSAFGWLIFVVVDALGVYSYYRFSLLSPMDYGSIAFLALMIGLVMLQRDKNRWAMGLIACSIIWSFYIHFYITMFLMIALALYLLIFVVPLHQEKILKKVMRVSVASLGMAVLPLIFALALGYHFDDAIVRDYGIMIGDETLQLEGVQIVEEIENPEEITFTIGEYVNPASWVNGLSGERYPAVYESEASAWVAIVLFFAMLVIGIVGVFIFKKERLAYRTYAFLAALWGVAFCIYSLNYLELPQIIEQGRMAVFMGIITAFLFTFPFELLSNLLPVVKKNMSERTKEIVIGSVGVLVVVTLVATNQIKKELVYEPTIIDADATVTLDLSLNRESDNWTLITTTNALSMVKGNGQHYEILTLLEQVEQGGEIFIPTEDIYVVVEEKVRINHSRIPIGEAAAEYFTAVSPEYANDYSIDIYNAYGTEDRDRAYYFNRPVLMSRLYYWMESMKAAYPDQVSVYYQDEYATVYHIQQDEYFLLNLATDYRAFIK